MKQVYFGNAGVDGSDSRGWILGHFIDDSNLRHSNDVEIKWGILEANESRDEWADASHERSVAILVSGNCTLIFPEQDVELKAPGDYVLWTKGTPHKWRANERSIVVTIRWPSAEN